MTDVPDSYKRAWDNVDGKLAKREPEECVAVVIDTRHGIVEPTDRLAFDLGAQPLVPYDYIWNEQTRNYEAVFVPGTEQDMHARENAEAQRRLLEMREKRLAEREARLLEAENARVRELGKG